MTPPEPELLPCPFCGGRAKLKRDYIGEFCEPTVLYYSVVCRSCYCEGCSKADKKEAITKWNTRQPEKENPDEQKGAGE